MSRLPAGPTPYADVNVILHLLLAEIRPLLGEQLVGFYLFGSLSLGDFDPVASDVDFLVVTAGELPATTLTALGELHARIAASGRPWATKLEGVYLPRAALRRYDPAYARHPTIGVDWPFGVGQLGPNWIIECHIVREHGVVVAGPPPRTLIDPVPPDDLRAVARELLTDAWPRRLHDPAWLRPRNYQAFAILTMCRALYTLAHGEVASKPVAAAWAREALAPRWTPLITQALAWRHDERPGDPTETIALIRYAIERGREAPADHGRERNGGLANS